MIKKKNWVLRDEEGRIQGPHSTEQIMALIGSGDLAGREWIARFPDGEWFLISKEPEFYDQLLEVLAKESEPLRSSESLDQQTKSSSLPPQGKLDSSSSKEVTGPTSEQAPATSFQQNNEVSKAIPYSSQHSQSGSTVPEGEVVDLVDKELVNTRKAKNPLWWISINVKYLLFLSIASAAVFVLVSQFSLRPSDERIRLLAPQKFRSDMPQPTALKKMQESLKHLEKDTFENYLQAENILVQVIEGSYQTRLAYSSLCWVYKELWPFTFQDSLDKTALSILVQKIGTIDPSGLDSNICQIIKLFIENKYQEALMRVDLALAEHTGAAILYALKGELTESPQDLATAISYLQKAQELWPQWIKPYMVDAYQRQRLGRNEEAASVYRNILKLNSSHALAKLQLGLIEYDHFRHPQRAQEYIYSAFQLGKLAGLQKGVGHLTLARIYFEANRLDQSLQQANLASRYLSSDPKLKDLLSKLQTGKARKNSPSPSPQPLVIVGDQYQRGGDCYAAQAEYRTAFDLDPKNATAALKAAQCLWRLSQTTDAIDWMNKAIKADPDLIDAYVTLADYYGQQFEFLKASQILARAQKRAPKSYEVLRGYALFEFRRNNFKGAIMYAEKALKFYENDVESLILVSESHLKLNQAVDGFKIAARIVELDPNNVRGQEVYAQALWQFQGSDQAIFYVKDLILTYPQMIDYPLVLAQIYMREQRYADAVGILQPLLHQHSNNKKVYMQLGQAQMLKDDLKSARESFLNAARLDPGDVEALFQLGLLYIRANQPADATVQFERVLRSNPGYPLAHLYTGQAALLAGNYKLALLEADKEKKLNPSVVDAYLLAAEAYNKLGQYLNCAMEYQRAMTQKQQSAEVYVRASQCFRLAGGSTLDTAISMLRLASKQESGNPTIYRELGAIYELKGDLDSAIVSYSRYFALSPNAPDRNDIEQRILKPKE